MERSGRGREVAEGREKRLRRAAKDDEEDDKGR